MVQEIKIDDNLTIQFEDMSGAEYFELTNSIDRLNREDFTNDKDYIKATKSNDFKFIHSIASKIFKINNKQYDINNIRPYIINIISDLVAGYVSDVNAKKVWDLKGGAKKQEERTLKSKNSTMPQTKKKK